MTNDVRFRVTAISVGGKKWAPIFTSFSQATCKEEYDKATKKREYKWVRLVHPNGEILETNEHDSTSTQQLSLIP